MLASSEAGNNPLANSGSVTISLSKLGNVGNVGNVGQGNNSNVGGGGGSAASAGGAKTSKQSNDAVFQKPRARNAPLQG